VPANVVAIVMKAQPGAELSCRASNYRFDHNGAKRERGVVSYYAANTLPRVTTAESWLGLISELSSSDLSRGRLKPSYRPSLQILGNQAAIVPGKPVSGDFKNNN
jgi:hypothetical protein